MYFEKENPITEFCIWIRQQKTKNMHFAMENNNTETAYNCRHFTHLDFSNQNFKTSKNMRFTLENTNTETVCIGRQFPCLNFSHQNIKKYAFWKGKSEYGNCPQL